MRHIITIPPSADQTFPHKLNFALGKTFQSYFDRFFPIAHVAVPKLKYHSPAEFMIPSLK